MGPVNVQASVASGSQRIGVSAVLALFVVGLPLLLWVDEREGLETAARS